MASNSTQIITDLGTVEAAAPYLTTQQARANAAAGPITDLLGTVTLVKRKAQEMHAILSYLLEGSQITTSLTTPSGGLFRSGDSNQTTTYDLLTGIYQILK